ncbi:MAG: hypothetical protein JWL58_7285 [Streptosporangiaceae bacterium]|nr:hypothetical protein [Streptosporangiaceae bacterium]
MNAQSSFWVGLEPVVARWLLAGRIRGRSWLVRAWWGLYPAVILAVRGSPALAEKSIRAVQAACWYSWRMPPRRW